MLLLHFPRLPSSSLWENLWKGFLVWVVSLLADLLFQDIFKAKEVLWETGSILRVSYSLGKSGMIK